MQVIGKLRKRWRWTTALTSGGSVDVPAGGELSEQDFHNCSDAPFFRFYLYSSYDAVFTVVGSIDADFNDPEDVITHNLDAGDQDTCYNLAAPFAGNNGWITLPLPFIKLTLTDSAASDHTKTLFWAEAWG
jgi:hypothetical protein